MSDPASEPAPDHLRACSFRCRGLRPTPGGCIAAACQPAPGYRFGRGGTALSPPAAAAREAVGAAIAPAPPAPRNAAPVGDPRRRRRSRQRRRSRRRHHSRARVATLRSRRQRPAQGRPDGRTDPPARSSRRSRPDHRVEPGAARQRAATLRSRPPAPAGTADRAGPQGPPDRAGMAGPGPFPPSRRSAIPARQPVGRCHRSRATKRPGQGAPASHGGPDDGADDTDRSKAAGGAPLAVGARPTGASVEAVLVDDPVDIDEETLEQPARSRKRKGRPISRYPHGRPRRAGGHPDPRSSRDELSSSTTCPARRMTPPEIDGNIYRGRVKNVLPGMEAAFIDIGTPKNAVLYRGDVRFDKDDLRAHRPGGLRFRPDPGPAGGVARGARIEQLLKTGQSCSARSRRIPSAPKEPASPRRCPFPCGSWCWIPNSETYKWNLQATRPDDEPQTAPAASSMTFARKGAWLASGRT